jgi:hypothetical protein
MRQMLAGGTPATLLQQPDALQKKAEELARDAENGVEEILTTGQRQRLREISLQQRGGHALADPEVAEGLQLTDDQRQKVQTIQAEGAARMQQLGMNQMQDLLQKGVGPLTMQNAAQKIAKDAEVISKETGEKLFDLLTTEQRARWKELTGKPFKDGR